MKNENLERWKKTKSNFVNGNSMVIIILNLFPFPSFVISHFVNTIDFLNNLAQPIKIINPKSETQKLDCSDCPRTQI